MAEPNQQNNPPEPATLPLKRKRGRPRKDEVPGSESGSRTQLGSHYPPPTLKQDVVGQQVVGTLDGVFDAGFLITVRVGNDGPLLRGMVFDQRLSVPISKENDIVPDMKMSRSDDIPIPDPVEPVQREEPCVPPPVAKNIVQNDCSQGSGMLQKGSEAVVSITPVMVSNETSPVTIQVSDQKELSAGAPKLD
ncbi:uncharacterized protein M6B38_376595 [Iris pallida]|uniref:AT-hook motif nuclear-localized protein n=1 Tax=Iris pallida TaxID=29817 RepID=A0AAX6GBA7_IRIPA|nr:uncharacterized protein M6B38_376595 [Iris pallida]